MSLTPARLLLLLVGGIVLLGFYVVANRHSASAGEPMRIYSKYWAYTFLAFAAVTVVSLAANLTPTKFTFLLAGVSAALTIAAVRDLRSRRALERGTPN